MAYLHQNNIIHRDLKPGNILVDDSLFPKISDFGLSKNLAEQNENEVITLPSGFKGTFAYCSPEILINHIYTKEGDVYAFGMIVYEIMTNEPVFKGYNIYQLLLDVSNGNRPEFKHPIPYCYKKLIEKCWNNDPIRRPTFDKIVNNLETDKNFITANINKEDFLDYVSLIKECKITQNKPSNSSLMTVNRKIEQYYFISSFLDLSKYEKKDLIIKNDFFKIYIFYNKDLGSNYAGQMSLIKAKKLTKNEIESFSKKLKIISSLNHPSLMKFIGYSHIDFKNQFKPIIVTEFVSKWTLDRVIRTEKEGHPLPGWNNTKKLITIYGIASGMSYLHSKSIVFCALKPSIIFLDDFLFPKIGDFGLSFEFFDYENLTNQSISGLKSEFLWNIKEF